MAAAQLYGRYGYNGVGLKQVAAESGSPIGSLYHFFPGGKDQLAAEALRMSGAGYQLLDACWIETVALEVASTNEPLRLVTAEIFDGWIGALGRIIQSAGGLAPEKARELAIAFITGLEGAFVLSRSLQSREPLLATGEMLVAAARTASRTPITKGVRR